MAIAIGEGRRHERNYCFCKEKRKKTCKIETMASTKQDRIIHARNYNDCSGRHARNYGLRKGWRNKHMQVTMIPARGQANTESYAKKHFRQFFRDKKFTFANSRKNFRQMRSCKLQGHRRHQSLQGPLDRQPHIHATLHVQVTYLPHKAVAEVSKDKEPIGRGCAEFNWFENELMSDSSEVRFKWFGCELIWDSNDLVVNWFEIQLIWLSIDLRFKWFGCQSIWDSSDLVVNRFEIQMSWLSIDLRFKWFGCQMIWGSSDLVVNWCVIQMILSNEAFMRDFLQKWSFETQKRSFCARLPSKLKLWSSKTKLLCETSFKIEALKLKNEAFLRDFLQKWSSESQKRSISARLP